MTWNAYYKLRFELVGEITNPLYTEFPLHEDGCYVMGRCLKKIDSDSNVIEGSIYPLFWPKLGPKCFAANPPFITGDTFEPLVDTPNYMSYNPSKFEMIGDFKPDDPILYPPPLRNGKYRVAICKEVLTSDTKAIKGGIYVIKQYPGELKIDAPDPPFGTGDGHGYVKKVIVYNSYDPDKFEILGDFTPTNTTIYPRPSDQGVYKIARCLKKLTSDTNVIVGGIYIIITYPSQLKVDAPDPPFSTGETPGKHGKEN